MIGSADGVKIIVYWPNPNNRKCGQNLDNGWDLEQYKNIHPLILVSDFRVT